MNSDLFLALFALTAFLVSYLFPRLRTELQPANYPVDETPRIVVIGALTGVLSVVMSLIVSVFHRSSGTPLNAASISYHSIMLAVVATPIIEEFLIRGILTESVQWACEKVPDRFKKSDLGPVVFAEVFAAIVFVSLHVPGSTNLWITFLTVPVLAGVLGELRRRHGIIASILGHIAYNVVVAFSAIILTVL